MGRERGRRGEASDYQRSPWIRLQDPVVCLIKKKSHNPLMGVTVSPKKNVNTAKE